MELPRLGLNAIGAAPPPDLTAGTLAGFVLPRYVIVARASVGKFFSVYPLALIAADVKSIDL